MKGLTLNSLITYYAETIYQQEIGLSDLTSRALAAANGTGMESLQLQSLGMIIEFNSTEYFAASWIAVFTIEKFGRRQLSVSDLVSRDALLTSI